MGSIDQFFLAADAFPAMPEIARQIVASVDDSGVGTDTVVCIAEQDPRFAADVLQCIRLVRPETTPDCASLADACADWPLEPLRDVVLFVSIASAFPRARIPDRVSLWSHAAATGSYARWLSHYLHVDADSAYLAGILLRSGQIVIAQAMPHAVAHVESAAHAPGSRLRLELETIGCRHTDVTAELGRRWQLPHRLIDGIRHAPDPLAAQPFSDLAAVLHIASLLADGGALGMSPAAALAPLPPDDRRHPSRTGADLLDSLQLDTAWLQTLAPHYTELADPVARWLSANPK